MNVASTKIWSPFPHGIVPGIGIRAGVFPSILTTNVSNFVQVKGAITPLLSFSFFPKPDVSGSFLFFSHNQAERARPPKVRLEVARIIRLLDPALDQLASALEKSLAVWNLSSAFFAMDWRIIFSRPLGIEGFKKEGFSI